MDVKERLTKARVALVLDNPFFGLLALNLALVEDASVKTAATNGVYIKYAPDFIAGLSADEVKGLLAHEVMHCAMGHQWRRGERNPKKWNIAADYVINLILKEAGFTLPKGGLLDKQYSGMDSETVYDRLPQGGGGDTEPNGEPGEPGQGEGQEGGPGEWGGVEDGPTGQEGEGATEADWRANAVQAANQARKRGTLPGGLERLCEAFTKPKANWRAILARFLSHNAKDDFSYRRPHRTGLLGGFYLPSMHSLTVPPFVLALDTSGSVDQTQIDQCIGEVQGILDNYDTTLTVLHIDTSVNEVQHFTRQDMPIVGKVKGKGGGGTDFTPAFEWIEANAPHCAALIYLTDMEGRFPDTPPHYPVLWAAFGQEQEAPFGEVIDIR